MKPIKYLAFDVGEKRIGVAAADSATKLAYPLMTIDVDGHEYETIKKLIQDQSAEQLVIGYPRNLQGGTTAQTVVVEEFGDLLKSHGYPVVYQDESLTSVAAEKYLQSLKRPYTKADIDAHAAAIILTDYVESHNG